MAQRLGRSAEERFQKVFGREENGGRRFAKPVLTITTVQEKNALFRRAKGDDARRAARAVTAVSQTR